MTESLIQLDAAPRLLARERLLELPPMICFRVTRFCNARCGFCLAPPDGGVHPPVATLKHRIDWLLAHGVKTIHFCGGEPTIHHDLPELIAHVQAQGGKSKMTTNGIALSDALIPALRVAKTEVKVSLHGAADHHNEIVGRDAFEAATATIRRLVSAGIATAVQTTIVTGHLDAIAWVIGFCRENGVRQARFLPFIPRGSGYRRRVEFGLTSVEHRALRELIARQRREQVGHLDIRLLDFNARPIHVVEPDGRVILESATEARDIVLYQIPAK